MSPGAANIRKAASAAAAGRAYSGGVPDDPPNWVEAMCRAVESQQGSGKSILQAFREAAPDLSDLRRVRLLAGEFLSSQPMLVDAWQGYSYDKRTSSGPYLDWKKVGYFDGRREIDVRQYHDRSRACADFVCREAVSVLQGSRPSPPEKGAAWPG